jgi:hypothetical protein
MVMAVATVEVFSAFNSYQSYRYAKPLSQWCYTLFSPFSFLCYLNFKIFFHQNLGMSSEDWMLSQMSLLIEPFHHYYYFKAILCESCLRLLLLVYKMFF